MTPTTFYSRMTFDLTEMAEPEFITQRKDMQMQNTSVVNA